jgi:hypothetical protein
VVMRRDVAIGVSVRRRRVSGSIQRFAHAIENASRAARLSLKLVGTDAAPCSFSWLQARCSLVLNPTLSNRLLVTANERIEPLDAFLDGRPALPRS